MPDNITIKELFQTYGPWVALAIWIITQFVPNKVLPEYLKTIAKRIELEDRLFEVIRENSDNNKELAKALTGLQFTLEALNDKVDAFGTRMERVESVLNDSTTRALIAWLQSLPKHQEKEAGR